MADNTPDPNAGTGTQGARKRNVMHYLREYCSKATFHGVHYLGEENRVIAERVWWSIFISASITACIYMIIQIYMKWLRSPVLVSLATQQTPMYDIPFPAVTICSKANIDFSKKGCLNLDEYVNKMATNQSVTAEEEKYGEYMCLLCEEPFTNNINKTVDFQDFYKFLKDCAPKRTGKIMFHNQYFQHKFEDLFKPTLTQEGICYTFNRFNWEEMYTNKMEKPVHEYEDFENSHWDPEKGYGKKAGKDAYPHRGLLTDIKYGLGVFIFEDRRNRDYQCDPLMQGYTVTLHIPIRQANTREEFFLVPFESAVIMPIKSKVTLTSNTIKAYRPDKRNCYFGSEKKLVYFKHYTQANCYAECMAERMLKQCGCVLYHMPRNSSTPVCGSTNCTDAFEVQERMDALERELQLEHGTMTRKQAREAFDTCRCRPMCNDIVYLTDPARFDINATRILAWMRKLDAVLPQLVADPNIMTTFILLYLKDRFVETTDKDELYGPSDFLSNFGGLLGLFTGFSMLSLIEVIYFLTLRLCANVKIHGNWAGIAKDT